MDRYGEMVEEELYKQIRESTWASQKKKKVSKQNLAEENWL